MFKERTLENNTFKYIANKTTDVWFLIYFVEKNFNFMKNAALKLEK